MSPTPALACLVMLLCVAACRPTTGRPPLPLPPDQPPPLVPGVGLAALRRADGAPPGPRCGAAVYLRAALPDPAAPVRDRDGEWLELVSLEPGPVELRDWTLRAGRRRLTLGGVIGGPTAALRVGAEGSGSLGGIRLRNRAGSVALEDPCGVVVSELTWGRCRPWRPDSVVLTDRPEVPRRLGPVRGVPDRAVGGCGQI